jgi:hypothetical protein
MRCRPAVLAVAALSCFAACFPLDRADGLPDGALLFDVVDIRGRPVAGARVFVDGAPRAATSDAAGQVLLQGLVPGDHVVRVFVFDDGDARPTRGAVVDAAGVARAAIPRGAFASPRTATTTQLLPPVTVADTAGLAGTVQGCDDRACRVVVVRRLALGAGSRRDVVGAVEGTALVDAGGAWSLDAVVPGPVVVVALRWDPAGATSPVLQARAASRPEAFAVVEVELDGAGVVVPPLVLQSLPATTTATFALAGNLDDLARVRGTLRLLAGATEGEAVDDEFVIGDLEGASQPLLTLDVPSGVFDVDVLLDDSATGRLRRALVVPGLAQLGTVAVALDAAACEDCDGDGDAAGVDDDDDGDGQPDAAETAPCRGPGRGTDLDGDCLCEPADPVPGCASNDPAACTPTQPIVCPEDAAPGP